MDTYLYAFEVDGQVHYVYAPSKTQAIEDYLYEKELSELPKNCVIKRTNDEHFLELLKGV